MLKSDYSTITYLIPALYGLILGQKINVKLDFKAIENLLPLE